MQLSLELGYEFVSELKPDSILIEWRPFHWHWVGAAYKACETDADFTELVPKSADRYSHCAWFSQNPEMNSWEVLLVRMHYCRDRCEGQKNPGVELKVVAVFKKNRVEIFFEEPIMKFAKESFLPDLTWYYSRFKQFFKALPPSYMCWKILPAANSSELK